MDGTNGIEWDKDRNREELSSDTEQEEGIVTWNEANGDVSYPSAFNTSESGIMPPSTYCRHCGERMYATAEICPRCEARISESRESKGGKLSLIAGVFAGFVALLFLGGIPVVGPILAGVVGGIVAGGGAARGAGVGFLCGFSGFIVLAILILGGTSVVVMHGFVESLILVFGELVVIALLLIGLFYGVLCMIGGALGGLIRR